MLENLKNNMKWLKKVTVEPACFIYVFAICLQGPAEEMFFYQRFCKVLYNDTWTCFNLHNETMKEEETKVQLLAAKWKLYAFYFQSIPPLIMTFVYGIISDRYSRKLVMALPLVGSTLECFIYILMAANEDIHLAVMVVGKFLVGMGGGWTTFFMGMMSYIASITTEEERTSRISIGNGAYSIAVAIALLVGGLILEATSFLFIFILSVCMQILGITYLVLVIKDVKKDTKTKEKDKEEDVDQDLLTEKPKEMNGVNKRISIISMGSQPIISATNVTETTTEEKFSLSGTFKNLVRYRENNGRCHLLIILPMFFFILFGNMPMYVCTFLFIKRQPLSWSQSLYGYYMGYTNILRSIALMIVLPILKRFLVSETVILIVAFLSAIASQVMMGFSTVTWMVFVSALIGFFSDTMYCTSRAVVSFILEQKEIGQIFAVIGTIQGISELAGVSLFNTIYRGTIKLWPGFVFVLGAAFFIIPLIMDIWLHIDFKRRGLYQPGSMNKKKEDIPQTVKAPPGDGKEETDQCISTV